MARHTALPGDRASVRQCIENAKRVFSVSIPRVEDVAIAGCFLDLTRMTVACSG